MAAVTATAGTPTACDFWLPIWILSICGWEEPVWPAVRGLDMVMMTLPVVICPVWPGAICPEIRFPVLACTPLPINTGFVSCDMASWEDGAPGSTLGETILSLALDLGWIWRTGVDGVATAGLTSSLSWACWVDWVVCSWERRGCPTMPDDRVRVWPDCSACCRVAWAGCAWRLTACPCTVACSCCSCCCKTEVWIYWSTALITFTSLQLWASALSIRFNGNPAPINRSMQFHYCTDSNPGTGADDAFVLKRGMWRNATWPSHSRPAIAASVHHFQICFLP